MLPEPKRVKYLEAGNPARQQRDEHRAEYRAGDVLREHAAAFGRVHPIFLADDCKARLAAHGKCSANGFALNAK